MTMSPEFRDYLIDMLRPLGPVTARAMFGGGGLYLDGVIFAIVFDDVLFLKADDATKGEFQARGMEPITYEREGRAELVEMSYWEAPAELLDDPDELCRWAERAWQAAKRASANKNKRRVSAKKSRPRASVKKNKRGAGRKAKRR